MILNNNGLLELRREGEWTLSLLKGKSVGVLKQYGIELFAEMMTRVFEQFDNVTERDKIDITTLLIKHCENGYQYHVITRSKSSAADFVPVIVCKERFT